jgi:hypothetical protein
MRDISYGEEEREKELKIVILFPDYRIFNIF